MLDQTKPASALITPVTDGGSWAPHYGEMHAARLYTSRALAPSTSLSGLKARHHNLLAMHADETTAALYRASAWMLPPRECGYKHSQLGTKRHYVVLRQIWGALCDAAQS